MWGGGDTETLLDFKKINFMYLQAVWTQKLSDLP